jgi:azurin
MSAHPPSNAQESGSFWSIANLVFAVAVGGFALFWSVSLLWGTVKQTTGLGQQAAPPAANTAAATETPAAAVSTPAEAPAGGDLIEITIKPDITNPLAYDTKEFTVKAGAKVRLTFNNIHPSVPQPHNIVIGTTGSKDKLMGLAMQMASAPDGMAKGFIPEAPEILFHTKLLQPNEVEVLEFTAPAAGDYPYLCTFPGHAVLMNGVMKVQ